MAQSVSDLGKGAIVRCCHCDKFMLRWLRGTTEIRCPRCKVVAWYKSDGKNVESVLVDNSAVMG